MRAPARDANACAIPAEPAGCAGPGYRDRDAGAVDSDLPVVIMPNRRLSEACILVMFSPIILRRMTDDQALPAQSS